MKQNYYSLYDLSDSLGVSYHTVYSWIRQGKLTATRLGGRVLIEESEWQRFMNEQKMCLLTK